MIAKYVERLTRGTRPGHDHQPACARQPADGRSRSAIQDHPYLTAPRRTACHRTAHPAHGMPADAGPGNRVTRLDEVERAIEEVAAGRPVIVVDDADRENEGDIIVAASKMTPA